ncbi:MAG: hypothetical protein ACO1QB_13630 [Verrucomicrobiales bacterium]
MIALKVTKNGELLCIAGADDLSLVGVNLVAMGPLGTHSQKNRPDETIIFHTHVGGMTSSREDNCEHFRWLDEPEIKLEDKIEIQFLEVESATPPLSKSPHDRSRDGERKKLIEDQMAADSECERRRFDEAKTVYFQLKEKFETEAGEK